MLGVSLRARRDTTQVMLGASLQARWDTTLVHTIDINLIQADNRIMIFVKMYVDNNFSIALHQMKLRVLVSATYNITPTSCISLYGNANAIRIPVIHSRDQFCAQTASAKPFNKQCGSVL